MGNIGLRTKDSDCLRCSIYNHGMEENANKIDRRRTDQI
jgi:hypothetical protein